mgnify:CR=1 FL=1
MLKKERNRLRAGAQRRDPKPKRMKLDEGVEDRDEEIGKMHWVIPDQEKRSLEDEREPERCAMGPRAPKRMRRDDIRMYMERQTEGVMGGGDERDDGVEKLADNIGNVGGGGDGDEGENECGVVRMMTSQRMHALHLSVQGRQKKHPAVQGRHAMHQSALRSHHHQH